MDQVGYAKIATRARAPPPARPDRTVTVTGAGVVGRGPWTRGPWSEVRGLWSGSGTGLGLAWLGLA